MALLVANLLTHSNLLRVELPVVEPITERLPLAFSQSSAITGRYLKFTIPCSIYECEQKLRFTGAWGSR
jgi:hypothetical protein